jgi:hypothetical protein
MHEEVFGHVDFEVGVDVVRLVKSLFILSGAIDGLLLFWSITQTKCW